MNDLYLDYLKYISTELKKSIRQCERKLKKIPQPTPEELSEIREKRIELRGTRSDIEELIFSILVGDTPIPAPDSEDYIKAKRHAEKLEELTAGSIVVGAALDAATDILSIWGD